MIESSFARFVLPCATVAWENRQLCSTDPQCSTVVVQGECAQWEVLGLHTRCDAAGVLPRQDGPSPESSTSTIFTISYPGDRARGALNTLRPLSLYQSAREPLFVSAQTHIGWWPGTSALWSMQCRRFQPNANICFGDFGDLVTGRAGQIPDGDIVTSHR